jgi:Holliday junction resolvase RusA-like endonuclease
VEKVSFEVIGQPVPKARARTVRKGDRVWSFTPKKVAAWEKIIREEALKHFEQPFSGPLALELIFYMKRPKSRRKEAYVHTTPDLDNLEKAVLDGLNEVAYKDDRLVVAKSAIKRYVITGKPRIRITVTNLINQMDLEAFFANQQP